MKIAIIGAGRLGRAFALRCAAAGLDVVLEDVMPANLRRAQDEYAELGVAGSLRVALTVEDAVREADVAVDFVPDELESKLEIFSLLDRMAPPKTVLCTPTDALSMTDLASCTYRAALCVGVRGGLAGEAVELVRSRFVAEDSLRVVAGMLARVGIAATVVEDREEPMLVKNRE
ncbi:3-hydroxyacyl-CoA dehydrogenase [Granulicella sp. 5B5]|uniref:3-hydroxyacyl-CoA dehydrogenase NAD-binding domain-containing protein n=1 Tax=Granulicella sp. 5B5 TaxID=1617967 RepID=UPI0015F5CECE|nr:3-hydroxyacyl-CoA dehydrogenase NAD-binding domain-containing protein [Granulicella sp. 5B5]QMV17857.1 3-hydroxyacyl-CoA dehydrogenase [Granulicella sp. 5B5]